MYFRSFGTIFPETPLSEDIRKIILFVMMSNYAAIENAVFIVSGTDKDSSILTSYKFKWILVTLWKQH